MRGRVRLNPGDELRRALRAWDPAQRQPVLDAEEQARLRRRMLAAAGERRPLAGVAGPGWAAALVAAGILAVVAVALVSVGDRGDGTPAPARRVQVQSPASIPESRPQLALDDLRAPAWLHPATGRDREPADQSAGATFELAASPPDATPAARRRQIHFQAGSGRRIVWTLDAEFPARSELALTGPD